MNPGLVLAAAIGGLLLMKRNRRPTPAPRPARRRNPSLSDSERRQLQAAQRLSQEFHGNTDHILELSDQERMLPRFVVEAGKLDEFTYDPGKGRRNDALYSHESGDRGVLQPKAKQKPLLVVDPRNRRPALVPNRSPMKLTDRGFVG